ncbi:MAG: CDF family Co(II)/Ni(II) efflux transporter DmeF [Candidatus Thermoplasmatota archaeon]|nr:CDF family Co(II)/Ni(II) efflux transporter DmeF [Candidatus Thermoplasmatota archaeon]
MSSTHSHHHHPHDDDEDSERKTRLVVAITLVMMTIEVSAGIFTKSMALLADGWHMGTHAAALGITLYAYYYVRTESKVKTKKDQVMALGGFASAIVLGLVALYIGWESLDKIVNPADIKFKEAMLVAILGLVINIACANILGHDHHHGHHHHDKSQKKPKKSEPGEDDRGTWSRAIDSYKKDWEVMLGKFEGLITNPEDIEDLNRRGAYLHVLADALVSVMVIMALLFGMLNPDVFSILDPLIGIVAAAVIARWAIGLLLESRNQILELEG